MAQHDYVIANGTGAAVRSDLNSALSAIVTNNSGTTEPTTTYAYQWWADTTTGLLKIRNAANNAWITVGTLASANLGFLSTGDTLTAALGSASTPGITFTGDLNTGIYSPGADQVAISTNGSGRLFVDSSGRVGVGISSARTNFFNTTTFVPQFQIEGTSYSSSMSSIVANGTAVEPYFVFGRTRAASIGGTSAVSINDTCGVISFQGSDGTELVELASLKADVDATPGANDMPGRIVFSTTRDNQSSPTEAMRIDSQQRVGIGTTSPSVLFEVSSATDARIQSTNTAGTTKTVVLSGNGTSYIGTTTNHPQAFITNDAERARIDTSGRLLVGTSTALPAYYNAFDTWNGVLQVARLTQDAVASFSIWNSAGNTYTSYGGAQIHLSACKSGTIGTHTSGALGSGETIGTITFNASDGSNFRNAARIEAVVDGAVSTADVPGRLVFSTTADGASSPTERMRINAAGDVRSKNGFFVDKSSIGTNGGYMAYDAGTDRLTVINHSGGSYAGVSLAPGATSWGTYSDERLKADLVPIDRGLEKVGSLRAVTGRYATDAEGVSRSFLIAQDVQAVLPEAVSVAADETAYLDLRYAEVIPLLVAALKESKERIETLEAKVAALEAS